MKILKSDVVVYIFFFVLSFCKGLGLEVNIKSNVYVYIYAFTLFLTSTKLIKCKYTRNELFKIGTLILIGSLVFYVCSDTTVLFTALSLLFLKNIDIKKLIKVILISRILSFSIMIIISSIGFTELNKIIVYRASAGEYIVRYCFGYSSPNLAHSTFNIIMMMILYLYYNKINIWNILLFGILNYIFYKYTASRTGFAIMILILLLFYASKKSSKIKTLFPNLLNFTFIFCIIISFLAAFLYNKSEIVLKINEVLSGRIRFLSITLNNFIPQLINHNDYKTIIFDNGYFDLIYKSGILPFIWFFIFQIKTNNYIKKNLLYKEAFLSFILFIYCIFESYYSSSIMNISLLFFMNVLFENKKSIKENKYE